MALCQYIVHKFINKKNNQTMEILISMFSSFVAMVSGVIFVTEAVNKVFKVEGNDGMS